jgi:uncharacterized lipoprotein YbaY
MRSLPGALLVIMLTLSCVSPSSPGRLAVLEPIPYRIISGTVFYPNNLYFPARVRLEITLVARDPVTRQSRTLVSQSIRNPQRFPVNFIVRYDRDDIIGSHEHLITVELFRELEDIPYLSASPVLLPNLSGEESIVVELRSHVAQSGR